MNAKTASAYFQKTTRRETWARYSEAQKESAVLEARALFENELSRVFSETESLECEAVYEQALHLLQKNTTPAGSGASTPSLNGEGADAASPGASASGYGIWSPLALRKFGPVRSVTRMA